ncbi:MAG: mechanosensitive ion channel [Alphaproteobacteria bacterium]|nr:mechanosensitive ion channel [Alphaproteobacteria bacterium]
MENQLMDVWAEIEAVLATYGLNVIGGLVMLAVGIWATGRIASAANALMLKSGKVDDTLRPFLTSLVRYASLAVVILAVLSQIGVQTASFLAVFGAAGLAIGLALQGTLSNVAAGVMLLLFRPFKAGDYIIVGGHAGTLQQLTLFTTELVTPDNVQIIVPNGQVWGAAVTNYSYHKTRRCDFVIGIGYGDDIGKAIETLKGVIDADSRAHKEPAPQLVVSNLGESAVDITIRIWCDAGDYWGLKFDFNRAFKEALDGAGISIPFPQREVHVIKSVEP